jgi:YggT family protein
VRSIAEGFSTRPDLASSPWPSTPFGRREGTYREPGLVGEAPAIVLVLADAQTSVEAFVDAFIRVYILLLLIYILLSWFRLPFSPVLSRIQRFLDEVCAPYLRLFRRFVPMFGPLDLSPILAIIVLGVVNVLLDHLIRRAL